MKRLVDVAVVGAGPVGLVLSSLLGSFDLSVLCLEKRRDLSEHPQAHFINQRTMEILRPLGVPIREKTPPLSEWRKFVYADRMAGTIFGEVDHFPGRDSGMTFYSPEPVTHLSQNRLVPILLERAQRFRSVQVDFDKEVLDFRSTEDGVLLNYRSQGITKEVQTRFAAIANGANSYLARKLGICFCGTSHFIVATS